MPIYSYRAKKGPGEAVEGTINAENEGAVVLRLEEKGYTPVWIREGQAAEEPARPRIFTGGVRRRDVNIFSRQMAGMLKSGVPILRALRTLREQTPNRRMAAVVEDIENAVRDGNMLSDAMAAHPAVFSRLYVNMVRAGESAGSQDAMLLRLADAGEREEAVRRKVKGAMAYPALVVAVGLVTVFVMLTFFMPRIISFIKDYSDLPLPTRMLIGISNAFSRYWKWVLAPLALVALIAGRLVSGGSGRRLADSIRLKMPVIGKFILEVEIARFARTMSLLVGAGLPMEKALALSAETMNNVLLRADIESVRHTAVEQGMSVATGMKRSAHFPAMVTTMAAVGEESGRLDEALSDIAAHYEKEVERKVALVTTLIEPVLILVVGGLVGFIALALMLPIFSMTRSVF